MRFLYSAAREIKIEHHERETDMLNPMQKKILKLIGGVVVSTLAGIGIEALSKLHLRYDSEGYDRNGYNSAGYDRQGYDKNGYDMNGFDRYGFDLEGRDKNGNTAGR